MGIINPFGCQRRCHIIRLLLRLTVVLIVVFILVILLLLLPLQPLLLIKGIGIECRANQPVFVCCASVGMKVILLTKLV
jgi:hypothetical protein